MVTLFPKIFTGSFNGPSNGLSGTPDIAVRNVVGAAATFSGDVSIGGTLTYEDVTNVDAVGLITARNGIKFGVAGVGGTIRANGYTTLVGVVTANSFVGDGALLTGLPAGFTELDAMLFN